MRIEVSMEGGCITVRGPRAILRVFRDGALDVLHSNFEQGKVRIENGELVIDCRRAPRSLPSCVQAIVNCMDDLAERADGVLETSFTPDAASVDA